MTLRKLLAQAMMLAVVAGSIFATGAAPASAGTTEPLIFIIHGLPGAGLVDICIGGSEVASRVPYAGRVKTRVAAGKVSIKVRKATKGQCKGKQLAAGGATLAAEANRTFVASMAAGKGKVTSFVNILIDPQPIELPGSLHKLPSTCGFCSRIGVRIEAALNKGKIHQVARKVEFGKDVFDQWTIAAEAQEPLLKPVPN